MIGLAEGDKSYQASSIMSKRTRQYNENIKKLLPYLQDSTNLRIVSTEQNVDQSFEQLVSNVEPTILLVRPGGSADAQAKRDEIVTELKTNKGFIELSVFNLI